VLLIGVRVPRDGGVALTRMPSGLFSPGAGSAAQSQTADPDAHFNMHLFPGKLRLRAGMMLEAIAFDALDLQALLLSTGGASGPGGAGPGSAVPFAPFPFGHGSDREAGGGGGGGGGGLSLIHISEPTRLM
jgi:hypothetical protein